MILSEDDDGIGGLGDRAVRRTDISHHGTAHQVHRILDARTARRLDAVRKAGSQRHTQGHRGDHLAHHADELFRYRHFFLQRPVNVIHRFHVKNGDSLFDRQSAGAHHLSGGLINEHHLVSHGISAVQKRKTHSRKIRQTGLQSLHRLLIFSLDPDDGFFGAHRLLHHSEGLQNLSGMTGEELSVQLKKRLAFRAVQKNGLHPLIDFHVGRKACASRSHNSVFSYDSC